MSSWRYGISALTGLCTARRSWPSTASPSPRRRLRPTLGRILDEAGRAPNRQALIAFFKRAQATGFLGDGRSRADVGDVLLAFVPAT